MTAFPADVPELSMRDLDGPGRDRFVERLHEGLVRTGFVVLVDHGIGGDLLERAYAASEAFFALPETTKLDYVRPGGQRGYTPFGREHAKDSGAPDLKEFWHVGRETAGREDLQEIYPDNLWPSEVPGFYEANLALYDALEDQALKVLRALAGPLEVEADFFDAMAQDGDSILRLLHYPPVADDAPDGAIRAAPHEDINLITLLVAASATGLEILDRDGAWRAIEAPRNAIVADAGDMLARITGGRIPATTHRVTNPKGANVSRYSMPFFLHPRPDAVLSRLPSCAGDAPAEPDVTAAAFLQERLRAIGLA